MAISVPLYTVDDLQKFPNDGNRNELLDGVLLVTPAPAAAHQVVVAGFRRLDVVVSIDLAKVFAGLDDLDLEDVT